MPVVSAAVAWGSLWCAQWEPRLPRGHHLWPRRSPHHMDSGSIPKSGTCPSRLRPDWEHGCAQIQGQGCRPTTSWGWWGRVRAGCPCPGGLDTGDEATRPQATPAEPTQPMCPQCPRLLRIGRQAPGPPLEVAMGTRSSVGPSRLPSWGCPSPTTLPFHIPRDQAPERTPFKHSYSQAQGEGRGRHGGRPCPPLFRPCLPGVLLRRARRPHRAFQEGQCDSGNVPYAAGFVTDDKETPAGYRASKEGRPWPFRDRAEGPWQDPREGWWPQQ